MVSKGGRRKPNWLLRSLIAVSMGVHLLLLARVAQLYDRQDVSPIEFTLRSPEPAARIIPQPPRRSRPQQQERVSQLKPLDPAPVTPPRLRPAPRPEKASSQPVPKPLEAPATPGASKPEALAWSPPVPSTTGASVYGSAEDYFAMVRMKIESNKKYPPSARRRQLEGHVKVVFLIESDGRVSEVRLSEDGRHGMLSEAAIEAVRASSPFPPPPRRLFNGPVLLEVSIFFELM